MCGEKETRLRVDVMRGNPCRSDRLLSAHRPAFCQFEIQTFLVATPTTPKYGATQNCNYEREEEEEARRKR